jgi:hypothetical protein
MNQQIPKYNSLFIVLIVLETILLFYTKAILGQTINSILYTICSLSIGILLLFKFYNKTTEITTANTSKKVSVLYYALIMALFSYVTISEHSVFSNNPISFSVSDILPSIQLMAKRFVQGTYVYDPTHEFGYLLYPTYLPLQWMPFTVAEILHFDYRWISMSIWMLGSSILFIRMNKATNSSLKLMVPFFICLLYLSIIQNENMFFPHTVEIMVAGYYILLIAGLNSSSVWTNAIVFTICLLSRFSLLLWLPLWFFSTCISGNTKPAIKITLLVLLLITALYVVPFLSKDWAIFSNSMKHYTGAAIGEWGHMNPAGKPYQLFAGTGFAHLFYEQLQDWDVADRIKRLQKVHFIASIGITVLMSVWFMFYRKKIHLKVFLMASFKIYLTIFLAFIQVPYVYLMVVANFVSIAIFSEQMRYKLNQYKQLPTMPCN